MATLAEWEAELQELRAQPGWTERAIVRWRPVREVLPRYPLIAYLSEKVRAEAQDVQRWEVSLWHATAEKGTPPAVVVDVPGDTRLPMAQPVTVDVAGRIEAGAAIAIRMPSGDVVFGSSPARPPAWFRRERL